MGECEDEDEEEGEGVGVKEKGDGVEEDEDGLEEDEDGSEEEGEGVEEEEDKDLTSVISALSAGECEMAPTSLRRLTSLQNSRAAEIELSANRLKEKPRNELNLNIIISRSEALNELWKSVRSTHEEIITREDAENDVYVTSNSFLRIQTMYEDFLDFLLTMRSELEKNVIPEDLNLSNSGNNYSDTRSAKLPKIDLPIFEGRYEDWENFCDLFTNLVHNAPGLADATKLQYLKSCMRNTAADLVKDVTTTNVNYATTWQALKTRFHNPRLIVYSHLRAIMDIPHIKKESGSEMRTLADESQRIVRALINLKMPVEHWDVWLVFIIGSRLDPESRKLWETELSKRDRQRIPVTDGELTKEDYVAQFPKFTDLIEFLENRAQTLGMLASETLGIERKSASSCRPISGARKVFHTSTVNSVDGKPKCALCSGAHRLHKCYRFKAKSPFERRAEVRRLKLCFNCFGAHRVASCTSSFRCSNCKDKHHTMIHSNNINEHVPSSRDTSNRVSNLNEVKEEVSSRSADINVLTANVSSHQHSVLLATAQILLIGPFGAHSRVRALLDQGSEASFVSDKVVNLLQLEKRRVQVSLTGLGANSFGTAKAATRLVIQSILKTDLQFETEAYILPKITSHLPMRSLFTISMHMFTGMTLADPDFLVPGSVDVILGADIYGRLLRTGLKNFSCSSLTAQDTALGCILSGPISINHTRRAVTSEESIRHSYHCTSTQELNESLQRFWALEEVSTLVNSLDSQSDLCEKLYQDTHFRDQRGRFIVRLPFSSELPKDGSETRVMALNSLRYIHRRFEREPELAIAYRQFMTTYEELGHMKRIFHSDIENSSTRYLPHHAVVQKKIRVVFVASRLTKGKKCLYDFLLKGPALQRDLSLILLNWRQYRYVFTADIIKMFRQIQVANKDQEFQRIVWSPSQTDPPVDYRLTIVTYGTSCAPFLAIRTLQQIAIDEAFRFPLGSQCLNSNTYVDDTFAGANELSIAKTIRQELIDILKTAGMELDKWAANHSELLPRSVRCSDEEQKIIGEDDSIKTLGISWSQKYDQFRFTTLPVKELSGKATKRSVLSTVARLFDPLGWLAPITLVAKILMQDLWILKCDWDDALPIDILNKWMDYCNSLTMLPNLSVNRWFGASSFRDAELHGFCDASSRAFAATVYIKLFDDKNKPCTYLLAAKSKVAPVKTISIPNLELCGAALLVRLISHVRSLDFLQGLPVFVWTDSQIVLAWLRKHPCNWKRFVANRVSFIHTELPSAIWGHVPSKENPADLASRGCKTIELINCDLWWHGPKWLLLSEKYWPKTAPVVQTHHAKSSVNDSEIFSKFSSWTRLVRVVAYCLRFLNCLRKSIVVDAVLPNFLTASELCNSRNVIIRLVQAQFFIEEINILQAGESLSKRHKLMSLNPIMDKKDGILRVGGRLANSVLSPTMKHPPILPRDSIVSSLMVRYAHQACLHGGPTLTSNTVIQHAWILGRNRLVKTIIRMCMFCQRNKPRLAHQMMGDLPASRVTPARPFSSTGLDYAGPFQIKTTKGRGHKFYKGYISLFVCFVTRAVHLEVVSDLTTKTFLNAYKRFVGRRGVCKNLYSDNASTFHAADKELRMMFKAGSDFYQYGAKILANDGTSWKFIPPTSPHYGGLWEAGVKSVKYHLKRTFGDRVLTYEEFSTVLVEIESCLNSRPICPLSSNVDDLQSLTSAHFLIGEASGLVPDEAPLKVPENRLERFHLLQAIRNRFWKRWSLEYMQHLQERGKWRGPTKNFAIGQLVLIRDDRYPPAKWPLGRVVEVHPGPDNLVRVVTVKTSTSTVRRHIARLCPLFIE
ncbi:uncharacterized protein [Prorops nasuta]|uniref:uncharacterized protein n=1 Tax=Prorops nasuta TaxID=863751 RepID=UPI0034CDA791